MWDWAYVIDGKEGDGGEGDNVPYSEIVRKYWNNFIVAWLRVHPEQPISRRIATSVTEVSAFIFSPL